MLPRRHLLAASTGLVALTPTQAAQSNESATAQVIDADRRLNECILRHDVAAARAHYDDDFVLTLAGGGRKRKANMLADVGNPAVKLVRCETLQPEVFVRGEAAVLMGVLVQEGEIQARRFAARMNVTDTWVRGTDGHWQLLAGHASHTTP